MERLPARKRAYCAGFDFLRPNPRSGKFFFVSKAVHRGEVQNGKKTTEGENQISGPLGVREHPLDGAGSPTSPGSRTPPHRNKKTDKNTEGKQQMKGNKRGTYSEDTSTDLHSGTERTQWRYPVRFTLHRKVKRQAITNRARQKGKAPSPGCYQGDRLRTTGEERNGNGEWIGSV